MSRYTAPLPQSLLDTVRMPRGIGLRPGGKRATPLELRAPPAIALDTTHRPDLLAWLDYAGVGYGDPRSEAALCGVAIFDAARTLAAAGPHAAISIDWDHTLSNFCIFEDVRSLIRVRRMRSAPQPSLAQRPMVAIEIARPFMTEFALGAMTGFALRQGIVRSADWERYRPQVCVATHTWPDRLGLMAAHFMPVLPLAEGMLPGDPRTYERFTGQEVRAAIHLHHFLDYAGALAARFAAGGEAALGPGERAEWRRYLRDRRAHHRKPLGAWAMRGWDVSRLLHLDDSTRVVADINEQARVVAAPAARAVRVRHSHSRWHADIREWHKIHIAALWRAPMRARAGAIARLASREALHNCLPTLFAACGVTPARPVEGRLPAGTLMRVHETPTTLGEFWRHYVEPTNRARAMLDTLAGRVRGATSGRKGGTP